MRDLDQALINIENIRAQLAQGTVFQGFGPAVMAITGMLAVLTTLCQTIWPTTFAKTDTALLFVWIVVAAIAVALIGVEAIARSKRHHGGMADQMVMNAIEQFLPAGFAGVAIGAVLYYYSPDNLWLLPGLWQVLVALGIFTALRSLPQPSIYVAAWYFLSGICVLILAANAQSISPLMMGIPFTIGQFLIALLLYVAQESDDDAR